MKDALFARYRNLITNVVTVDHHPEIKTHPHHLHTPKDVDESAVRSLDDLLAFLAKKIK